MKCILIIIMLLSSGCVTAPRNAWWRPPARVVVDGAFGVLGGPAWVEWSHEHSLDARTELSTELGVFLHYMVGIALLAQPPVGLIYLGACATHGVFRNAGPELKKMRKAPMCGLYPDGSFFPCDCWEDSAEGNCWEPCR